MSHRFLVHRQEASKSMLYIWMPEGQAAWRWWAGDTTKQPIPLSEWHVAEHWDALLSATAATAQREVTVFFPTSSAQLLQRQMSRQQRRQLGDQGVRYLLEEYTLGSVEQLAVRDQLLGEDELNVLALPSSVVAQYIQNMGLGNWQLHALLPDFLLIPLQDERPSLLLHGRTPMLRLSEGYAVLAEDLSVVLPRLPQLNALTVLGEPSDEQQMQLSASELQLDQQPAVVELPERLARHPYNFLPKPKGLAISIYWKALAALLLVAVLVQVVHDGLTAWRYQQVAVATQAQAEQQFRQWFPDEQRIINLRRQMEGRLQRSTEQDVMALSLIGRVGPVLQQAQLVAESVRYRDQVLEINVLAANLAALEQLRGQMTQQGLNAELGAVTSVGTEVSGLLRIKP